MLDFSQIRAVVSDMDGVLWRGDAPMNGLHAFFEWIQTRHIPFALATNNSRRTQADYVAKLAKMGVTGVQEQHIMTSGIATAHYLQTRFATGTPIFVVGGAGLRHEIESAGFVLSDDDKDTVEAVVVGLDLEFTYTKARQAMRHLMNGAIFVGSNDDKALPLEDGLAPGAGSILAMLQTATGKAPLVMGKPNRAMFDAVLKQMKVAPEQTLMIGDRLNTDIEGAYHVGLKTALVLTGVDTRASAQAYPVQPDAIFEDLASLVQAWRKV
jgi:4-nitrophenyl phosphatase